MLWGPSRALWVLCLALILAHRGNPPELRHQRVRRARRAQGGTRVPSTEVAPESPFPPHTSHGGCGRAEAPQTRKMPPLGERDAPMAIQGFLGGAVVAVPGSPAGGCLGGPRPAGSFQALSHLWCQNLALARCWGGSSIPPRGGTRVGGSGKGGVTPVGDGALRPAAHPARPRVAPLSVNSCCSQSTRKGCVQGGRKGIVSEHKFPILGSDAHQTLPQPSRGFGVVPYREPGEIP